MEMAQVEIYARRLQAKHALFVFDACFSGSLFTSTRAVPAIINYKTTLPVRQFITSGSADEMVPDKSIFGEQFVRAISGEADMDKDTYVTGSELGDFLQSSVVNYSRNSQHPQYGKIRSPNLDKGDFVFPQNQEESTGSAPAPAPAVTQVIPSPAKQPEISTSRNIAVPRDNPPAVESKEVAMDASEIIPLVYVQGGTFQMGDHKGESFESYVHAVAVKSFYIGKFEVTQKQWKQITGSNPSSFTGCDDCPVDRVSYEDAKSFLSQLSQKTGKKYRLPTEAEWEFAARGGIKSLGFIYAGSNFIDHIAWSEENANKTTHMVGKKHPNELGIYDMTGNIYEWCTDWFNEKYYKSSPIENPAGPVSGENRVIRGGSWKYKPKEIKVTHRMSIRPTSRYSDIGIRVVREE